MLNDFHKGGIAYSFGISNDVSWDKAMADCGYDVFMYDHTISALPEENDRFHWEKIGVASDKTEDPQLKSLEELIFPSKKRVKVSFSILCFIKILHYL